MKFTPSFNELEKHFFHLGLASNSEISQVGRTKRKERKPHRKSWEWEMLKKFGIS